jgi:hypothetical protein
MRFLGLSSAPNSGFEPEASPTTFPAEAVVLAAVCAINGPMAKKSSINAVKFRLGRVAKDWDEITAILRREAGEPNYAGPDIEVVERTGGIIAVIRERVSDWAFDYIQRRPRTRKLGGPRRDEILKAIRQAVLERQ